MSSTSSFFFDLEKGEETAPEVGGGSAAGFNGDFPFPFPLLGEEVRLTNKSDFHSKEGRSER